MRRSKITRPGPMTVGEFFKEHAKALKLELIGSDVGFARPIPEPTVNRPGLALAGFFTYFAYKRIQVIGNSEQSYLKTINADFSAICDDRHYVLGNDLETVPEGHKVAVFANGCFCKSRVKHL